MKAIDIVKPQPTTALEAHRRWLNRLQVDATIGFKVGKKINVKYIDTPPVTFVSATSPAWFNSQMITRYGKNWRKNQEFDNDY